MSSRLESWRAEVREVCVDEAKRVVVARTGYFMKARGQQSAVENDLVWWIWMDERGEKVERSMEFVDPKATEELRRLMELGGGADESKP